MKLEVAEIPSGVVQRGTPIAEIDDVVRRHADLGLPRSYFAKEAPRAHVHVPGFSIARVPVTRGGYAAFCRAAGKSPALERDDHPVDVTWGDATQYCAWLAGVWGVSVRLPSEVEWERVARGDDTREYPWGDRFRADAANLAEAGIGGTAPVGSFPQGASPYGVLDLVGNLDEWTSTVFAPYDGAPSDVPAAEAWAPDPHVTRGGSYLNHRDMARCARRHGVYPPHNTAGFRVVIGDC